MMQKFHVTFDPNNTKTNGSTQIIVNSVNEAAKKLGLYGEGPDSKHVLYDCLGQKFGKNPDALWIAYELPFPKFILQSAGGTPILGLSKENAMFVIYGGYPSNLVNYVSLGVDTEKWKQVRRKEGGKFTYLGISESNNRCGYDILVPTFGETFYKRQDVKLLIKDRNSTIEFKHWIKNQMEKYEVEIELNDKDIYSIEEQRKLYEEIDVVICVNRSHTWGLVLLEAISCGLPCIIPRYSGFSDYCTELNTSCVDFDIVEVTQEKINELRELGLKNHLLPITTENYLNKVFWAEVNKDSLRQKMLQLFDDQELRRKLSYLSMWTAKTFTWERTAVNMSCVLSQLG